MDITLLLRGWPDARWASGAGAQGSGPHCLALVWASVRRLPPDLLSLIAVNRAASETTHTPTSQIEYFPSLTPRFAQD
jgi:hypothetical protein